MWFSLMIMGPLKNTVTCYKKQHLAGWQRSSETLKRKDIGFLNDVISLFFLPLCVVFHPTRCFLNHVTSVFCKGPIATIDCDRRQVSPANKIEKKDYA